MTVKRIRRRYLVLLGLRWLPVGLTIPVMVLLMLQRGLSLSQIGLVSAAQGLLVLVLELPTGGLADALGRRPVLLFAACLNLATLSLLAVADSLPEFLLFGLLQGVFRALDSGPLDSWYVDAVLAEDPNASYEGGLSGAGAVLGIAIAAGALVSGALVALDPIPAVSALTTPVVVAALLQALTLAAITLLLTEPRRTPFIPAPRPNSPTARADATHLPRTHAGQPPWADLPPASPLAATDLTLTPTSSPATTGLDPAPKIRMRDRIARGRYGRNRQALVALVREVPALIGSATGLLRRSPILMALIAVELLWGFGMVTFETLMPPRLSEIVGDPDTAASLLGPVGTAAWLVSAAGAGLVPLLARWIGAPWTGALLRLLQGATVAAMGLLAGPVGVIAAYLACYLIHGAANPVHMGLLHRQVDGPYRTTVLSLNSMVAQPAGALGAVVLTAIADRASIGTAMIVGAVVLAAAAPLYLPARRTPPPHSE